ncbi:hypothetical protein DFH06DRAFT_591817 [Mycena polygramma]|nr:hypothetical protein DFH06DRAFT_591817 [Mycena polygramma]
MLFIVNFFWLSLFLSFHSFLNCTLSSSPRRSLLRWSFLHPSTIPRSPCRSLHTSAPLDPRYRFAALACSFAVDPSLLHFIPL